MNDTTMDWRATGWRWWWMTAVVILLDQASKLWLVAAVPYGSYIHVLPVLDITHTVNPGAAWSAFADMGGIQRWILSALAVGVSIGIIVWLRKLALSTHTLLIAGLTLILGGAIGNVIDRLRLGHVIDFVHAHWGDASFPAFNVADMAISIGAAFVILDSIFEHRREKRAAAAAAAGKAD